AAGAGFPPERALASAGSPFRAAGSVPPEGPDGGVYQAGRRRRPVRLPDPAAELSPGPPVARRGAAAWAPGADLGSVAPSQSVIEPGAPAGPPLPPPPPAP